jgi:uncharacterized protein YceK
VARTAFFKFGFFTRLTPQFGLKENVMKSGIGILALLVLISFLMVGCSSIRARTGSSDKEWTVYPGIHRDVNETGELFSGKRPEPDWVKGVTAAILIADLPFSTVFDTVLAPYDLYRIYTRKSFGEASESSKQPQHDKNLYQSLEK